MSEMAKTTADEQINMMKVTPPGLEEYTITLLIPYRTDDHPGIHIIRYFAVADQG
jgi:hypothetical protein